MSLNASHSWKRNCRRWRNASGKSEKRKNICMFAQSVYAHTLRFAANKNSVVNCFSCSENSNEYIRTVLLPVWNIYCRSVDYFACIAVKRQWNTAVADRRPDCFIPRDWNQKPDATLWCFRTAGTENVKNQTGCFVQKGDITAFGRLSDRIRTMEEINNNKRWCPGTRGTVSDAVLTSVEKKC